MKAVKDKLNICYIGGGSRNWAWVLMKDLSFENEIGGTISLYDINYEAARANEDIGNALMAARNPGRWKFRAVEKLADALTGADFIFVSILPGDFDRMAVDVHAPEQYGIYQSVGDTVGAGGFVRALRTIPMYQEIARAIRDYASDAWVFNYTNPMTICTRALYREFPGIKAFGCCHEVFGTQKILVRAIEDAGLAAVGSVKREDIKTSVLGINHFTWIDRASWNDVDLLPVYRKFAEKYAQKGLDEAGDEGWLNKFFKSRERIKFDLFLRYGLIAAAGDRHLAEFCPPKWYLDTPEMAASWDYELTPVSFRIAQRNDLLAKSAIYRSGKELLVSEQSGEEGIPQMKALLGLGDMVTNVNLPNRGQIPGLPAGAVVETNALFARDRIEPVASRALPADIQGLTLQHISNQEGIIEAAFTRDLELACRVFQNDMQLQKTSRENGRKLFKEMTDKTLFDDHGYKKILI